MSISPLLAADELTVREWGVPQSPLGWITVAILTVAVVAWVILVYRKDSVELSRPVTITLIVLRLAVFASLLLIWLNPQERTQEMTTRPSRVAVLLDTSLSMRHPAGGANLDGAAGGTQPTAVSRAEAVAQMLRETPLIKTLREQHEVSVYTFDTGLVGPVQLLPRVKADGGNSAPALGKDPTAKPDEPTTAAVDWTETLRPKGLQTRIGESLTDLVRQVGGRTLSGIVVVTDGSANAGVSPDAARDRASSQRVKILTVGVGTTDAPVNLQLVDIQAPTDVQVGDPFDVTVLVQSQGLAGKPVEIELIAKSEETGEEEAAGTQQVTLLEDNVPVEAKFPRKTDVAKVTRYIARVKPVTSVPEINRDDNEQSLTVTALDRPTKVLLIAGGPMRDYQFVRNLLYRHKGIDVDVYLQTGAVGTSQESDHLLLEFPSEREQMFEYDMVIAFDPDWRLIPPASVDLLYEWVAQEAGGLILVAGDVNTLQLAAATEAPPGETGEQLGKLKELYPVVLNSLLVDLRFDRDSSQPWPLNFSPEGQTAGFLQLTDDPISSQTRWKDFAGFYRCYPTSGPKAGATVYAKFSDPRSDNSILMASQFFGQGRTFYLGSAEMWRLRSVDEDDYDRFWIKSVREFSQGRIKRGNRRGLLIPESHRVALGQTVRVRARLLNPQFQPLSAPTVPMEVYDPQGRPILPPRTLTADPNRAGEFTGDFRASLPGAYRLEVQIPQGDSKLKEEVIVALPKLEDENIRQNVPLLTDLAEGTGGVYLPLNEASAKIPGLLPNREEQVIIDQRLKTLWDRGWVMYLVVGFLATEWLIRKVMKLA